MVTEPSTRSGFLMLLGRLLGVLLRLLFVLLLAVGAGAGIYYGLPFVYRQWVEPVQANAAQLSVLSGRVDNLGTNLNESQTAHDERLTALETGGDAQRERLASAEASVEALKASLASEAEAREALELEVAALRTDAAARAAESASLRGSIAELERVTGQLAGLRRQATLLAIRNDLLLARIQLVAENFGEARSLLETVGADLSTFLEGLDGLPVETRTGLANRLVTSASLIKTQPAAALQDLESVWAQMDAAVNPGQAASAP